MVGVALALLIAAAAFAAPLARAELSEKGDLFVHFQGGIDPVVLPRTHRVPIAVTVQGTVKTFSGQQPPALRKIEIELNRNGRLETRGLPTCGYRRLVASSPAGALANCRDALVGEGAYKAKSAFPEQEAFPSRGHVLAFNARYRGRPAILAHIYGIHPAPATRLLVFYIHHSKGAYGTAITGELPPALNRYGYAQAFAFGFFRRYVYRGKARSYLSAACPAPLGFSRAIFPFARVTAAFEDGRTLSSTLVRSCRVRS